MIVLAEAMNSHSNAHRADGCKMGAMPAEKIKVKDEIAYTKAMRVAGANKRKAPKVTLPSLAW